MTLDELRRRIDAIDDRIVELLAERAEVALEVAEAKRAAGARTFHDPERERAVLERLAAKGTGRFPREAVRAIFREIMSACLSIEEPLSVAFLGPEGTFSHMAARHAFGLSARYREATSIAGVFDAVARGDAERGIVPIENSTEGSVDVTLDALLEGHAKIRQELVLAVSHCLLGRAAGLTNVERVYSHPQALAQCRVWLAKNLPTSQLVQTPSTAAAAREALADPAAAAIASRLAGELYGLPVLRERIEDRAENATRFAVVAREDAPKTGDDKTSLAFSTPHEKGALRKVLAMFEDAGLNLSRIESRPSGGEAWEYIFFVDLEGHRLDPIVARALAELEAHCRMVRVLGSYPRAKPATGPG